MKTNLWHNLLSIYQQRGDNNQIGNQLLDEYLAKGYVERTCREMLEISDGGIAWFYAQMSQIRSSCSPVQNCPSSSWMLDHDICLLHVRATGVGGQPGTFIQAAKLLPAIRSNAMHLLPFTMCEFNAIYTIRSTVTLADHIVDPFLTAEHFDADDQVGAFVQAAHLLGKVVGFDLEPHTAQFSFPVLMHPELFRWIKLDEADKNRLQGEADIDEVLKLEEQRKIVAAVRHLVAQRLQANALDDLEPRRFDDSAVVTLKRALTAEIIAKLIKSGYWTILSHTWSGVGVPAFADYNSEHHYPRFHYLNRDGCDEGNAAYGVLTPYCFYHDLSANSVPSEKPTPNRAAIEFYASVFSYWRDHFDFDFIRHDFVDHVFDSIIEGDFDYPASDRPTPAVIREVINSAKSPGKAYIGNLAERMGNELDLYGSVGFDLIMGSDATERLDARHMEKAFAIYDQILAHNKRHERPMSITYVIDTHDTGDPLVLGDSVINLVGSRGILGRLFAARFTSCGCARRPKYEVMGIQDLSHGLYHACLKPIPLFWIGDVNHNRSYHRLEDIYESFKDFLRNAAIVHHWVEGDYTWWIIRNNNRLLIPILSLENEQPRVSISEITLDLTPWIGQKSVDAKRYDFSGSGSTDESIVDGHIKIASLDYGTFALYSVVM